MVVLLKYQALLINLYIISKNPCICMGVKYSCDHIQTDMKSYLNKYKVYIILLNKLLSEDRLYEYNIFVEQFQSVNKKLEELYQLGLDYVLGFNE
jgi:hypothetical protein